MLIHGIHSERSGGVGTGGDHVGVASDGDDIRSYDRCVIKCQLSSATVIICMVMYSPT